MPTNIAMPKISLKAMLVVAVLAALALIASGCTDQVAPDPTPVQTFKITPAAGKATAGAATTPSSSATATAPAGNGATTLQLTAQDSKFDKTELAAATGAITIKFANKDGGVPHNLHVFEGKDAKGKSVGQTDLASGPVDQELKLTLTPGAYYYQCDAHPTTMKGTLAAR